MQWICRKTRKAALVGVSVAMAGVVQPSLPAHAQVDPPPEPNPLSLPFPPTAPAQPGTPELLSVKVHQAPARARRRRCARGRVGRTRVSLRVARRGLLCTLNAVRRSRGLRPLRSNRWLLRASLRHSRAMIRASFFSHIEPAGIGLVQRVGTAGYLAGAHQWLVGENIGFGRGAKASPLGMVRTWMGSTGHRANILAPQFREVGLGIVPGTPRSPGGRGATYTTDFGVRR